MTMQAQKEAPADMQCKDKFLLQCVVATPGVTPKDVTPDMVLLLNGLLSCFLRLNTVFFFFFFFFLMNSLQFSKEAGHRVEETKLRVVYVDPPQPPSPVREGSEEGSSPRASVSDSANVSDFTTVSVDLL